MNEPIRHRATKAAFPSSEQGQERSPLEDPLEPDMATQMIPLEATSFDPDPTAGDVDATASHRHTQRNLSAVGEVEEPQVAAFLERASMNTLLRIQELVAQTLRNRYEKKLAILFSDIAGSSAYFEVEGDTAGRLMLMRHQEVITPLVAKHSGRVVKTIGDGILAVFPSAPHAVAAAIQMQRSVAENNQRLPDRERFQVRIGMSYGPALVSDRDQDVFGDVVNLAARVQSEATGGQILITESIRVEVSTGLSVRDAGQVELRWRSKPAHLFEVLWGDPLKKESGLRRGVPLKPADPNGFTPLPEEPLSLVLNLGSPAQRFFRRLWFRLTHW